MIGNLSVNLYVYCCVLYSFEGQVELKEKSELLIITSHCFHQIDQKTQWKRVRDIIWLKLYENETLDCQNHYKEFRCSQPPLPKYITYTVFWVLVLLLAFFGNLIVLLSVVRSLTLKKTLTNYFIASLAASDLSVALCIVPIKTLNAYNNLGFCYSLNVCKFYITLDTVLFVASITNLFVISIDRYIAVHYPYDYNTKMTPGRVKLLVGGIWLYALSCGILLNFEWGSLSDSSIEILTESLECVVKNKYYVIILYGFAFYIPAAVMGVIFLRVLQISKKNVKDLKGGNDVSKQSASKPILKCFSNILKGRSNTIHQNIVSCFKSVQNDESISMNNPPKTSAMQNIKSKFSFKKDENKGNKCSVRKVTKTVVTIYGVFLICWIPVSILSIGLRWCPNCFRGAISTTWPQIIFADILPILNSTFNPFVYGLTNKQYRHAFRILLTDIWSCVVRVCKNDIEKLKKDKISEYKTESNEVSFSRV